MGDGPALCIRQTDIDSVGMPTEVVRRFEERGLDTRNLGAGATHALRPGDTGTDDRDALHTCPPDETRRRERKRDGASSLRRAGQLLRRSEATAFGAWESVQKPRPESAGGSWNKEAVQHPRSEGGEGGRRRRNAPKEQSKLQKGCTGKTGGRLMPHHYAGRPLLDAAISTVTAPVPVMESMRLNKFQVHWRHM